MQSEIINNIVLVVSESDLAWRDSAGKIREVIHGTLARLETGIEIHIRTPSSLKPELSGDRTETAGCCFICHANCQETVNLFETINNDPCWVIVSGGTPVLPDRIAAILRGKKVIRFNNASGRENHFSAWIMFWSTLDFKATSIVATESILQEGLSEPQSYVQDALAALVGVSMVLSGYVNLKNAANPLNRDADETSADQWLLQSVEQIICSGTLENIARSSVQMQEARSLNAWSPFLSKEDLAELICFLGYKDKELLRGNLNVVSHGLRAHLEAISAVSENRETILPLVENCLAKVDECQEALGWLIRANTVTSSISNLFHDEINPNASLLMGMKDLLQSSHWEKLSVRMGGLFQPTTDRFNQSLQQLIAMENSIRESFYFKRLPEGGVCFSKTVHEINRLAPMAIPAFEALTFDSPWLSQIEIVIHQLVRLHHFAAQGGMRAFLGESPSGKSLCLLDRKAGVGLNI